jgi:hypothetical protein
MFDVVRCTRDGCVSLEAAVGRVEDDDEPAPPCGGCCEYG